MTKSEILKYYKNQISDIEDEETKNKLLNMVEDLDDLLICLEVEIDDALDLQAGGECPSMQEELEDFELTRKEIML